MQQFKKFYYNQMQKINNFQHKIMKNKLASFDRFYQQKNVEYIKLINQTYSNKSNSATKRRLLHYVKKCVTQTVQQKNSHRNSDDRSLTAACMQSPIKCFKRANVNCTGTRFPKAVQLAGQPQGQEMIFQNEYVRQRMRVYKIKQIKVKQMVLCSKIQQMNKLNKKAFKIRSGKFNFFNEQMNAIKNCSQLFHNTHSKMNPQVSHTVLF